MVLSKMTIWAFDQNRIAKIPRISKHRQIVRTAAHAFHLTGKAQPHLRLPQQIKCDIGKRDIFFDNRGMAAPFADAVRQDEGIVPLP